MALVDRLSTSRWRVHSVHPCCSDSWNKKRTKSSSRVVKYPALEPPCRVAASSKTPPTRAAELASLRQPILAFLPHLRLIFYLFEPSCAVAKPKASSAPCAGAARKKPVLCSSRWRSSTATPCCTRLRRRPSMTRAVRPSACSCHRRRSRARTIRGRTSRQGNQVRSRHLDRRDRGPGRAAFSRAGEGLRPPILSLHGVVFEILCPGTRSLGRRLALRTVGAGAHDGRASGLYRGPRLGWGGAGAVAFVVVERGAIFGAGDRHGRAAPRRQHHQRGSFGQPVVEPRQPVDIVHGGRRIRD